MSLLVYKDGRAKTEGITWLSWPGSVIIYTTLLILVLRWAAVYFMGLMPQDAYYYYLYSQHLSLSYYDHPPMIAYFLRFFSEVFGKSVFTIKLGDTIITLLSTFAFYRLSRCFLSQHKASNVFLLFFSTFMVTILSLVTTPDIPLMLFWTLSLSSLYQAIFNNRKWYWILSGLLMGLAFDSKYTGIMLPLGLLLFLIFSSRYRRKLLSPWLWSSLLLFAITILPVVIWNIQNDFASFRFQSESRLNSMGGLSINPLNFAGVLGHQSAILSPILFFGLLFFLFKLFKKQLVKKRWFSDEHLFLLSFFIPIFLGFMMVSFVYWVKLNWMMPAYVTGIILLGRFFSQKVIKAQVLFSLAIHLALAVEIFFYPIEIKSDDTWFGWKELSVDVRQIKNQHPDAFVFSADDYKTSAILNFYSDSLIYSRNIIGENALQFNYIPLVMSDLKGKDAIFINSVPQFTNESKENNYPPVMNAYFDTIEELDPILIKNHGHTMRKFLVFYCRNYHPQTVPVVLNGK